MFLISPRCQQSKSYLLNDKCHYCRLINSTKRLTIKSSATERDNLSIKPNAQTLADLDSLLHLGKDKQALECARQLKEQGILKSFSAGRRVPKQKYTLAELKLNKIQPEKFLSPTDTTLNSIRNILRFSFFSSLTIATLADFITLETTVEAVVFVAFLLVLDQVGAGGAFEALAVDSAGRLLSPTYANRVALHEAGHFLTAYLNGLLPKDYSLTSWDAYTRTLASSFKSKDSSSTRGGGGGSFQPGIQGGTTFCDSEFQEAVQRGSFPSSMLDIYSCVALAGVATEWMRFGSAEGGLADVQQLDSMLGALRFTQAKADDQVRWAVLNTVELLRRHIQVQDGLAEAMQSGKSVVECIQYLEESLKDCDDV